MELQNFGPISQSSFQLNPKTSTGSNSFGLFLTISAGVLLIFGLGYYLSQVQLEEMKQKMQ